jgi:tetratricopeptide (TPR) repeat protein
MPRADRLRQMMLRQEGLLDAARRSYESILRRDERNAEAWLRLGLLRLRGGDVAMARSASEHAERLASAPTLRYLAAMIAAAVHGGMDDWEGAAASYRAALAVVPDAQSPVIGLSEALLRLGDHAQAAALLTRVLGETSTGEDPWWDYAAGPSWRLRSAVDDMRRRIVR